MAPGFPDATCRPRRTWRNSCKLRTPTPRSATIRLRLRTRSRSGAARCASATPTILPAAPGTWGGSLLQLSSAGGEALGGRARRPCASPEEYSAEVFLRRAGLPPVRSDLRAARVLPDAHRDGDPARQHRGNRAVRRARGRADRIRQRRAGQDAHPDPGAADAALRSDRYCDRYAACVIERALGPLSLPQYRRHL